MFIYFIAVFICLVGLYMIMTADHYIAKIIGLAIFQNSILLFYIAIGKVIGGVPPVDTGITTTIYSSPVPHVLMLTAIVVGFATLSMALALACMVYKNCGSLRVSDLNDTN